MKGRLLAAMVAFAGIITMSGCWDYRGMDEMDIVSGIAIDKGAEGGFEVTLEIVNISSMDSGDGDTSQSIFITADGPTMFEAVRNAKKSLYNVLYFGSVRTVVISRQLAEADGLTGIFDVMLRDFETRETIAMVISQEDSAKALITTTGMDTTKVSFEMARILEEDEKIGTASVHVQIYQAYNMLKAPGKALVLPVFHTIENNEKEIVQVNGLAIFNGDKLAGFLSPEETHYFLLATKFIDGGVISFPLEDGNGRMATLEVHRSNSKPSVTYENGKVTVKNNIELRLGIIDLENVNETLDEDAIHNIAHQAERAVEQKIRSLYAKTQAIRGGDIYGYGNHLYKNQLALWRQLESRWDTLYSQASLDVEVKVVIVNSGFITQ